MRQYFWKNLIFVCCIIFCRMTPLFSEEIHDLPRYEEPKKTVCLNMIVKNESSVIRRCLQSVLPLIDTWVIVDTGSCDGTQKIIQDFMRENNIPGELHERSWVNFGHNREEALMLAKDKADYLLFIDADDVLCCSKDFELPNLIHDVYLAKSKDKGMQFHLWLLVKASLNWHWHEPLHEYIEVDDAPEGSIVGVILNGIEYVYVHDGARAKDPATYAKDLQILLKALEKEPNNNRLTYYLAQTYCGANNFHKALEYYQKRIAMGGRPEEVFNAMMWKAKIQTNLNVKPEIIAETYLKALEFRPTRPEPIFYLSRFARLKGDYQKGYEISKKGIDMPPSTDILDLEYSTYDGIILECAFCALELGKLKECMQLCRKLNDKPQLLHDQKENLKAIKSLLDVKIRSKKALNVINNLYGAS